MRTTSAERQRTPLLIIDAEGTRLNQSNAAAQQRVNALYEAPDAKPALSDVLEAYDRQIISCSSVQIVAPITRVVLNPNPGPPEDWVHVGRDQAMKMLLLSLNDAQWNTITSENGIGIADLTSTKQKALFRDTMPTPFVLRQWIARGNVSEKGVAKIIAPEQARVHVVRKMLWGYRSGNGITYGGTPTESAVSAGDSRWLEETQPGLPETNADKLRDAIRSREPNKLKPGDLSFNTPPLFGKQITLAGVETVGGIVQRVAEQTGLELYADRRVSGLKVQILGPTDAMADTADMMKALCYALTGTIRQVHDDTGKVVCILTGDRAGLGAARMGVADWAGDVRALNLEAQDSFNDAIRTGGFASRASFADGEPKVSPEVMARIEKTMSTPSKVYTDTYPIPVTDLSSELQQRVAAEIGGANNQVTDAQNIYAKFSVYGELVVPGYGTYGEIRLGSLSTFLPHQPADKTGPVYTGTANRTVVHLPAPASSFAALMVAVETDEEADKVVAWAKTHGFTALFVTTSLWDQEGAARLTRVIKAGKESSLAVYPSVSLWKVPPRDKAHADSTPSDLARSRNLFGETLREYANRRKDAPSLRRPLFFGDYHDELKPARDGDWLDGGAEDVRAAIAQRLHTVATIPGIAGLVLSDVAPPGFNVDINDLYLTGKFAGYSGGYSEPLRAELIRRTNVDPIDLTPVELLLPNEEYGREDLLPFFTMGFDLYRPFETFPAYHRDISTGAWSKTKPDSATDPDLVGWDNLRQEVNRKWAGKVRDAANLPASVSLYWEDQLQSRNPRRPWMIRWTAADVAAPDKRTSETLVTIELTAQDNPTTAGLKLGKWLEDYLKGEKGPSYTGVVVDISELDLNRALPLIDVLAPVP